MENNVTNHVFKEKFFTLQDVAVIVVLAELWMMVFMLLFHLKVKEDISGEDTMFVLGITLAACFGTYLYVKSLFGRFKLPECLIINGLGITYYKRKFSVRNAVSIAKNFYSWDKITQLNLYVRDHSGSIIKSSYLKIGAFDQFATATCWDDVEKHAQDGITICLDNIRYKDIELINAIKGCCVKRDVLDDFDEFVVTYLKDKRSYYIMVGVFGAFIIILCVLLVIALV